MPKVGSEYVSEYSLSLEYSFDVHFNKKLDFHVKLEEKYHCMPEAHNGMITGISYDFTVKKTKEAIKAFWKASAKEPEKVIIYKISRSLIRGEIPYHMGFNEISFSKGNGLTIDFKIRYMLEYNGEILISRYDNPKGENTAFSVSGFTKMQSSDYHMYKTIPWTEESEAFFKNLNSKIVGLIQGVTDFFGDDPKQLLNNIENNSQKLIG